MRKALLAATCLYLTTAGAAVGQVNSSDLKWGPAPPQFPKGAQMAVLTGDPTKAGLFIVRLKMPAGYKIPAHHHPTDEVVTVISGEMALGMGDKLDMAKSAHLQAGGFAMAPAPSSRWGPRDR